MKTIHTNNFYDVCTHLSNSAEDKLKEFDEHLTFDEERRKVFLQGMMYASAILAKVYKCDDEVKVIYDYEEFVKLHNLYEKETKPEKAHQISMDEYLEEKNKENNIDNLAKQIAKIICKEFADDYKFKSKPAELPSFLKRKK